MRMRAILSLALLLTVVGCNNNNGSSASQPTPSPSPAATPSVAGNAVPAEKQPEEWVRSEKTDQMNGQKSVFLTLRSSNDLHYGVDGKGRARITLGCEENFVSLLLEPGSYTPGLRYKFDESAPERDNWGSDGRFLSTLIESDRLNRLMRTKTLKIEFTPPASMTQIATFDLRNLKELVQQEKACNFRKKASL